MKIGVALPSPRSVSVYQTSSSRSCAYARPEKSSQPLPLLQENRVHRQRWLVLSNTRFRDDNSMLFDIHRMGPRPRHPVHQVSFARLQPRQFEKGLRNGGVSGTSGPNKDGNFVEWDYGHTKRVSGVLHSIKAGDVPRAAISKHASAHDGRLGSKAQLLLVT